jgi:gliding motility-associated-like protein
MDHQKPKLIPYGDNNHFNCCVQLLKKMSSTSPGWNGTFNVFKLPASDYWFNLTFEYGKIIKDHFSLKR